MNNGRIRTHSDALGRRIRTVASECSRIATGRDAPCKGRPSAVAMQFGFGALIHSLARLETVPVRFTMRRRVPKWESRNEN
jgi:hypothetical protein